MSGGGANEAERLPEALDRFLGVFYDRRGWRSELRYDVDSDRLYLVVHLLSGRLGEDDRFLSLVEYFTRTQNTLMRQRRGLPVDCRLLAADGSDLTRDLRARAGRYLDDARRGGEMRRRLFWLALRRRLFRRLLPAAALWAAALTFVLGVLGLSLGTTLAIVLAALAAQALLLWAGAGGED